MSSQGHRSQPLPLNKLLSATHIIRLRGEIVRLLRRERERQKYVVSTKEMSPAAKQEISSDI